MKIRIIAEVEVDNKEITSANAAEYCERFCGEIEDSIYNMDDVIHCNVTFN